MLHYATSTVGCKVNQYETQAAAALLERLGLSPTDGATDSRADLVLVNTCCVTATAAAKSRRAVRRALRRHPGAHVLVLGCYATEKGEALTAGTGGRVRVAGHRDDIAACLRGYVASLAGATAATPAKGESSPLQHRVEPQPGDLDRSRLSPAPTGPGGDDGWMRAEPSMYSLGLCPSTAATSASIRATPDTRVKANIGTAALPPIRAFAGHQRAFLKVQDGCDAFCSYCIVPYLRRRLWSRLPGEVLDEARTLVASGHKEIVLCGVCLGAYGRQTANRRQAATPSPLPDLLRRVAAIAGLWRVRLSSLHPADVTDELLAAFADSPRVAPHLHLPLQAGSAQILRRMNRQYAPEQFLDAVARFRRTVARPAITTDVVVGFPGETEEDFAETLRLVEAVGFAKVHVFPFSARAGTAAWNWRHESPRPQVVRDRCRRLAALAGETAATYRRQFLGRTVEALTEAPNRRTPPASGRGLTDRYLEVTFPLDAAGPAPGQVVRVQVTALSETGLAGTLAGP